MWSHNHNKWCNKGCNISKISWCRATLSYSTLRWLTRCWRRQSDAFSTLTWTFIRQQLEAFSAIALKAADGVSAEVITAAVLMLTLVNVCGREEIFWRHFRVMSYRKAPIWIGIQREYGGFQCTGSLTFACFSIWLQREADRAAAAHACGSVFTSAVTPPIVQRAGLWNYTTQCECIWSIFLCLKTDGNTDLYFWPQPLPHL